MRRVDPDHHELAAPSERVTAMEQVAALAASALRVPLVFIALPGTHDETPCVVESSDEIPRWTSADEAALWRSGLVELVSAGPAELRDMTRNYPIEQLRIFVQLRLGSLLGVPIRSTSDHVYGVICAAYPTATTWNEDDLAMLQQFAGFAASDLELRRRVEELDATERRLTYYANHDALTGLATRAVLLERLRVALERPPTPASAARIAADATLEPTTEDLVAVVMVEITRYSAISARHGAQAGEQLLVTLAGRLRRAAGDALVARVGRDQFGVLVERVETAAAANEVVEQLRAALEQPISIASEQLDLGVRTGLSLSATTATLAEHLIHRADVALGHADASAVAEQPVVAEEPELASRVPVAEEEKAEDVAVPASEAAPPTFRPSAITRRHEPSFSVAPDVRLHWERPAPGILARIKGSWRSMTYLLGNAVEFAQLDKGEVWLDCVDVSVAELLDELRREVVPRTYAKAIHYHTSPCEDDVIVRADPAKVRRLLRHLLENAIKFTEPGGEIAVECDANDNAVRLRVSDTGRGIPASWLAQVFEPYVQVDAHLTPRGQRGLGLGLTISQRLATGMGGALEAESEVGVGSAFTLTLLRA